jgi:chorismate dehydratase
LRPKVGHIQFLNCLPLYHGLVKSSGLLDLELIKGTPTELNALLISGRLDISPISSIEYARHHDSLRLLPSFTVSSDGEVKSILLLSRFPIEELEGKKIALTSTSATSHVLLKLILKGRGISARYVVCPPDLDHMVSVADAALLIGDSALEYHLQPRDFHLYDLGMEWKRMTGEKMVYAVWAVREDFAKTRPEAVKDVFRIIWKSMEYSMRHLNEIAEYGSKWEFFSPSFLRDYFESLRFDFDEDYQRGLLRFYTLASGIGELGQIPQLQFTCTVP